ncbi:MAG: response regulator, partial [Calditrichaeota bacterium]|nr:response regulator [Calditrichota bacterium]
SQDEFGMLASSFNAMVNDLREARDNAEIAIKAKTDFLATMSHEIRTPMNGVIGMTSLLSETPLDCEQKECVETIRVSGETLLSIINDILDFSKIDSGKLRLEEHDFNLKGMVDEVIDLLAPSIKNKNLDLLNIIESDVPAILRGDATRLRQVLFNLVGNAIKFTAEGEILISISRVEIDNNIATLEFSIKDTGIGITDSQITKIFDAFAQADSSINRRFGGSGLGLAICSKLVQLMGGNIGVKSTPGIGSVFTFSVQMTVVSQHQPEDIHIPDVIKGKQVLIVDDNQTNCRILAMQCNKWQLVPHIASDNTAAMAIVESGQHFDIILMDYQMPDVDGVTLTEQIWQYSKRSIPTILLSSLDISSEISRFLDNANTEFVQKPIKMDRLYTALKLMLSRKKSIIRKKSIQPVTLDTHLFEKYPLKILVAEDNQINQKLILRILSKMGYNADLVSNGLEVLEAIQRQQYDLVLMDVQMPEMDGIEATRQIRNDTAFDSLRIVALTANALEGDREKCLNAGMNDYLSKPFKFDEFQHKIVMQSESDGSQVT